MPEPLSHSHTRIMLRSHRAPVARSGPMYAFSGFENHCNRNDSIQNQRAVRTIQYNKGAVPYRHRALSREILTTMAIGQMA